MLILALDTATPWIGAAVFDGSTVLGQAGEVGAMSHGERLAPIVAAALAQSGAAPGDLTSIAVGVGPGPFTGLRVGLAHARVMGLALGIEVGGFCTLDVIASQASQGELAGSEFLVATDARRKEVYWAAYDATGRRIGPARVGAAGDVPGVGSLPACGQGAWKYQNEFADPRQPQGPDPAQMARMAAAQIRAGQPPASTEPMYLRRPDAAVNIARKRVTQ